MVGVRDYFAGKTVFLTGVTGLVGKLVLEKLLRCCESVERVLVLVRAKKGKDAEQRLKEICDGPVSRQNSIPHDRTVRLKHVKGLASYWDERSESWRA